MGLKYIVVVLTDGTYEIRPIQGEIYAELNKAVGGFPERLFLPSRMRIKGINFDAIVNEEGLLQGLEQNVIATILYRHAVLAFGGNPPETPIVGNAVFVKRDGMDSVGFTEEEAQAMVKKIKEEVNHV